MEEPSVDDVRLPDLEVIRRYSIAVKREHAPVAEVVAALRADLERLSGSRRPAKTEDAPALRPPAKAPVRRAAPKPAPKPAAKVARKSK